MKIVFLPKSVWEQKAKGKKPLDDPGRLLCGFVAKDENGTTCWFCMEFRNNK